MCSISAFFGLNKISRSWFSCCLIVSFTILDSISFTRLSWLFLRHPSIVLTIFVFFLFFAHLSGFFSYRMSQISDSNSISFSVGPIALHVFCLHASSIVLTIHCAWFSHFMFLHIQFSTEVIFWFILNQNMWLVFFLHAPHIFGGLRMCYVFHYYSQCLVFSFYVSSHKIFDRNYFWAHLEPKISEYLFVLLISLLLQSSLLHCFYSLGYFWICFSESVFGFLLFFMRSVQVPSRSRVCSLITHLGF